MECPKKYLLWFIFLCGFISLLALFIFTNGMHKSIYKFSFGKSQPLNTTSSQGLVHRSYSLQYNGSKTLTFTTKYPSSCPYLGLTRIPTNQEQASPTIACQTRRPSEDSCKRAISDYGKPEVQSDRKCDEQKFQDICSFVKSEDSTYKLSCDPSVCKGEILLGVIHPKVGIVTEWRKVELNNFHAILLEAVKSTSKEGFDFLLLKCEGNIQALVFPPELHKANTEPPAKDKRFNINIIVLDCISRPHFYRVLPKTILALRQIANDDSVPATALDFGLFQSIGQNTFDNIKHLFSGVRKDGPSTPTLGIDVLYSEYHRRGYQTLFQEDLCWYDHWGIMLSDIKSRETPGTTEEKKSRWAEFQEKVSKLHVDKFGLTHFSCVVVNKYGRTNHFDSPSKVCLNGQFYSKYFLDYLKSVFRGKHEDKRAKPVLSYTHLNTAHTNTGNRIKNIDANLAEFFQTMARDQETLTMILSDHGHRLTSYSQTAEGRIEQIDPLFFMVVPYGVAKLLGESKMAALFENRGVPS